MYAPVQYQHELGGLPHSAEKFYYVEDRNMAPLYAGNTNNSTVPITEYNTLPTVSYSVTCRHEAAAIPHSQDFQYPSRMLEHGPHLVGGPRSFVRVPNFNFNEYPKERTSGQSGGNTSSYQGSYTTIQKPEPFQQHNNYETIVSAGAQDGAPPAYYIPRFDVNHSNTINPRHTYVQPPIARSSSSTPSNQKTEEKFADHISDHIDNHKLNNYTYSRPLRRPSHRLPSHPSSGRFPKASLSLSSSNPNWNPSTIINVADICPTNEINNAADARAYKTQVREKMPHSDVPQDAVKNGKTYVDILCKAMRDTSNADDGRRELPDGTIKRESSAFRQFATKEFDEREIVAGCWLLLDALINLHKEGCRLRASQLPAPIKDGRSEVELTFRDRFEAVKTLLETEKTAAKDVVDGSELDCMRIARCPLGIKRDKIAYRKTNDRRPSQAKHRLVETASGSGLEEEEGGDKGDAGKRPCKRTRVV